MYIIRQANMTMPPVQLHLFKTNRNELDNVSFLIDLPYCENVLTAIKLQKQCTFSTSSHQVAPFEQTADHGEENELVRKL
jgi:hypothetical protein